MFDFTKGENGACGTHQPGGLLGGTTSVKAKSEGDSQEGADENGGAFVPYRLTPARAVQDYRKKVICLTFEVNELQRQRNELERQLERQRNELEQQLNQTQAALQRAQNEQSVILAGIGYRFSHRIQAKFRGLLPANTRRGKLYEYGRRGAVLWLSHGFRAVLRKSFTKPVSYLFRSKRKAAFVVPPSMKEVVQCKSEPKSEPKSQYEEWIDRIEKRELSEAAHHAGSLDYRPLISVVMPVYNVDRNLLQAALQSVQDQFYDNWELCICDDASTNPDVRETLLDAARQDPRIKVVVAEKNGGISVASNRALDLATGEFVAFLDHDDELAPHALYQVAKLLNICPDADVIYSDEDKIDMSGRRYDLFLKPDWSPDLMRSCNYLCHLTVLRTCRVREVGGFRPAFAGSQDYDLFLRIIERTKAIHHIPKVLYHWRACPGSTASAPAAKMYAHVAARVALQEHLDRCGVEAEVAEGCTLGRWRIQYKIQNDPCVSIILPTGGNIGLLDQCIKGIVGNTDYRNFELVLIDNSKGEQVQSYFPTIAKLWPRSRYLDFRGWPFNFSALNNQAVNTTQSPLLLFLNDDTVPIHAGWLEAMVEHAQRPEVGAVGCKLLYTDGTIQHAGVVMGLSGNCNHAFRFVPGDPSAGGYFCLPHMTRNVTAVTGACLMTRSEVYREVGGFDEINLAVAFQDVDLCLKMRARGYLVVYTPHARLYHLECQTKAEKIPNVYEVNYMQHQWAEVIAQDPYYHQYLSRTRLDYSLNERTC